MYTFEMCLPRVQRLYFLDEYHELHSPSMCPLPDTWRSLSWGLMHLVLMATSPKPHQRHCLFPDLL